MSFGIMKIGKWRDYLVPTQLIAEPAKLRFRQYRWLSFYVAIRT
jgi:hypothetical protein